MLLWLHVPALMSIGLVRGLEPVHVAAEVMVIAMAALAAGRSHLPRSVRMAVASFGLASASAILVHLAGGYVEMHFHFFVVIVIVSLYQHWLPFLGTIAYVAVHHGVLGTVDATSVFNHPDAIAHPWKWASIHAGFILAESVAAVYAWSQSESAQLEAQAANTQLAAERRELERRNWEMTLIAEMGDMLQSCETMDEAYDVISRCAGRLFGGNGGAMYLLGPSRNLVEAVASWGEALGNDDHVFAPSACWALRRGAVYEADGISVPHCRHVTGGVATGTICIPMAAQSEAMGIVHLRGADADVAPDADGAQRQLAVAVAEHLALAMANFRLRESLRAQSIRDPLTGLYNRRYLEESLDRELRRAVRNAKPLSVVSIDVDHFKAFNDTFGHSAGDAVLAAVGRALLERVRGEDIACRMGGEELLLLLPECPGDVAITRAEQVRNLVRELAVEFQGQTLGMITISLGVATFPDHAATAEQLMLAADAALYTAKGSGRDRTAVHAA